MAVPVSWHTACRDIRVAQQIRCHEPVVTAGLFIVDDRTQLPKVRGAQQMLDVLDRLVRERRQRFRRDLEELPASRLDNANAVTRDQPVFGVDVLRDRQDIGVIERGGHAAPAPLPAVVVFGSAERYPHRNRKPPWTAERPGRPRIRPGLP